MPSASAVVGGGGGVADILFFPQNKNLDKTQIACSQAIGRDIAGLNVSGSNCEHGVPRRHTHWSGGTPAGVHFHLVEVAVAILFVLCVQ